MFCVGSKLFVKTQHTIIDRVNDTNQIITKDRLIGFIMARSAPKYR